jgi:hypothetical protein
MLIDFSKLCTPAYIYFIISFIYLIINSLRNFNIISIVINIIIIILWSLLLNFLCNMGYSIISWLIILLPFFMFI